MTGTHLAATLDLFIGVRHSYLAWEVSLYGKNVTNERTTTDIPQAS
jgi:hypothetical protein